MGRLKHHKQDFEKQEAFKKEYGIRPYGFTLFARLLSRISTIRQ